MIELQQSPHLHELNDVIKQQKHMKIWSFGESQPTPVLPIKQFGNVVVGQIGGVEKNGLR